MQLGCPFARVERLKKGRSTRWPLFFVRRINTALYFVISVIAGIIVIFYHLFFCSSQLIDLGLGASSK